MTKIKKGDKAPNFKAKNQNGEWVSLSDFKGKKLVLYFYPKANTPTCTVESCNLSDNHQLLQKAGYAVLGVSADSEKQQLNFKNKFKFPFDLLADENQEVIKAYDVWAEKSTFGKTYMGLVRTTFIINELGKIEEVIDKVESKNHAQQILSL